MPRFVVLLHETPPGHPRGDHFDLMLEADGALWTWAASEMPAPGRTVTAERLPDHRLAYLEIEGEISGGRGRVRRVDQGAYETLEQSSEGLKLRIQGRQLVGTLTIVRRSDDHRWCVSLSSD